MLAVRETGAGVFRTRTADINAGNVRIPYNAVRLLQNGDEIFPAMLEAIRGAERSVCMETYVYWSGKIAEDFAQALAESARRGVMVHVILDWYGCIRMSDDLVNTMRAAGVQVEEFRPLRWYQFVRANYRTHRKLLVVDGKTGFTGGVGIAEEWMGHAQDPDHWRDNHYRFEGPVVREMQAIFFLNWSKCGHTPPARSDLRYYPEINAAGRAVTAACHSSPLEGNDRILTLFRNAISRAQKQIWIATAYFMPGDELLESLIKASRRGVAIKILMCGGHIDKEVVRFASRAHWGRLLKAGIELYEYQPTLFHVKMLIVDNEWVSIGSANFDARSVRLNDELNINLYGEHFVGEHIQVFERDLEKSKQLTLEAWKERPWSIKLKDASARLLRHHL